MNRGHTHDHGQGITLIVLWSLIVLFTLFVQPAQSAEKSKVPIASGKAMALKLCQACHVFKGADQAGTVGPPFLSMSQRFPNRERLRNIIYDPQKVNKPDTMMPPFGRHGFLNKKQTEQLIDFLYTL